MYRRIPGRALGIGALALFLVVAQTATALADSSALRPTVPSDITSLTTLAQALVDATAPSAADAAADLAALRARVAGADRQSVTLLSFDEPDAAIELRALAQSASAVLSRMEADDASLESARAAALAIAQGTDPGATLSAARLDALTVQVESARAALARDAAANVGVQLAPIALWAWPIAGKADVSQGWGPTIVDLEPSMTYRGTTFPHFHDAIDIAAPMGSSVLAATAGKVTFVGHFTDGAMVVKVESTDGLTELYAHLDDVRWPPSVRVGDAVTPGERIGSIGMTGMTTGPHLHFAVDRGTTPVDPLDLLPPRT